MTESEFHLLVDEVLNDTEQRIEKNSDDIDFDTVSGILTLEFENGSKIIINRQLANQQIWIAAQSGGFHLSYVDKQWICDDGSQQEYYQLLSKLCTMQGNEAIDLN